MKYRTKAIVSQHRKTKKGAVELKATSLRADEPVKVIEPAGYETTSAISAQENLTEKDAITETRSLLSPESKFDLAFKDKQIVTTIKEIPDDTTPTPTSMENQVAIYHETSDTAIAEMVNSIKNLTPEQLASVIMIAANTGLSEYHLSAIITVSQQVLNTRQQFGDK